MKKFLTSLPFLFLCCVALADQVTLKNGDRLSGSILKYDGKNLVLKSELAGDVTIPWEAVTAISSTQPLNVGLKDGQMVVGAVTTTEGKIQVATKDTGAVTAPRDSIQFIRSKDEQAAYEAEVDHYRNPRLVDLWVGFLDLGYAASRGNADTSTFTLSANATRATSRDKIEAHFNSIFSSSDAGGKQLTTANAKRGGVSYNLNINRRWFGFGSVDLENDQFQSLDLRFVPAGGLGYHALQNERTILDMELGAAENREFFSTGLNRSSTEILLGEELTHKVNKSTSFHQKLVFFPNLTDGGNYRINFDLSAVTSIRKWFSWQFTVSDRFLSNPVPGRKENDVLFTTGARLTFAK